MTADDLLKALYGVGIAALGLVTLVLGVITRYVPDMIRTFLETRKLISLERAGIIASRSVEARTTRGEKMSSDQKSSAAVAIVNSIAPNAAGKTDNALIADVVEASVVQMRQSLPNPELSPDIRVIPLPPRVPEGL